MTHLSYVTTRCVTRRCLSGDGEENMVSPEISLGTFLHRAAHLASKTFDGGFGQFPDVPDNMPEERSVVADGRTFHYLLWPGQGVPILLVHGLNANAWMWGRVGGLLASVGPVYAITLPGHGHSDSPPAGFMTQAMAQAVLPAIDALIPGSFYLVGHSYGGKVAVALAAMLGTRVCALSLADPVLPKGLNPLAKALPAVSSTIFAPERGPFPDQAAMEASLKQLLYLRRWGEVEQRFAQHGFAQQPDGTWSNRLSPEGFKEILFGALEEDSSHMLKDITCPVQLLRPHLTVSFLPGEVAAIRRKLKKLTVRRISGDHAFVLTNPTDTAHAISTFFFPPTDAVEPAGG